MDLILNEVPYIPPKLDDQVKANVWNFSRFGIYPTPTISGDSPNSTSPQVGSEHGGDSGVQRKPVPPPPEPSIEPKFSARRTISDNSQWSMVQDDSADMVQGDSAKERVQPRSSLRTLDPALFEGISRFKLSSHDRGYSGSSNATIMPSGLELDHETQPNSSQQHTPAVVERPQSPPDILKDDITLIRRIFDGSYSDVWAGEWKGQTVAVKVLRCLKVSEEAMNRKRNREVKTWWELDHPSVLPLLGYVEDMEPMGPLGAMVSPYCVHGNVLTYLKNSSPDYRLRITLWLQVLEGMSFLHGHYPMIVHGDLKPANIVIDEHKHARICDFGLARLILDHGNTGLTTTTAHTGTTRYKSRELALNARAKPTASSDVYALGCLGLEFILSRRPYDHRDDATFIIGDIQGGINPARRPKKLVGETARFWDQLEACWDEDPTERPTAHSICRYAASYGDSLAEELESKSADEWF